MREQILKKVIYEQKVHDKAQQKQDEKYMRHEMYRNISKKKKTKIKEERKKIKKKTKMKEEEKKIMKKTQKKERRRQ